MFLNSDDIESIKSRLVAGEEPWKSAFDSLMSDADRALLDTAIYSVTRTVPSKESGYFLNDFVTERPYTKSDGVIDPDVDRRDYQAAIALSKAVRDLGLAYAYTGVAKYASRAIERIHSWCINPETRMRPHFTNHQSKIELCITIPGILYGADLVYNSLLWDPMERGAFLQWVDTFATNATQWTEKNNYDNWRIVLVAAAGALLDNDALLQHAFERYKSNVNQMIAGDPAPKGYLSGELPAERRRTKSLFYSLYALNAMTLTAEIALHRSSESLYDFIGSDEKSLKLALDYHASYAANPETWPYQQIDDFKGENCAMFELAYSQWKTTGFKAVIDQWGRPMYEERIMGPTTLTHSR
ncbi:MAG: alginate lyase family protein [Bacteroidota bacterium]